MNQTSHRCSFARYVFFSVLGTLGVSCYILADTFFVSHALAAAGLTALNLAIPVYNFIHGSGLMLGMGGATKFSICKGQKDQKRMDDVFSVTVWLALFGSAVFFVAGLFFSKPLALLLGADSETLTMTTTYLRFLLLFAPCFIFNDVLLCFVRNDNAPKQSMAAMLIGSFANILLDYVFVFPLQLGMLGAVLATGLSPIISIFILSPRWLSKGCSFHFVLQPPQKQLILQNLSLGFPSLVTQLSSGIVMILFNMLILRQKGGIGVAAYGIVANLSLVVVALYTGIAQGVQPLLSSSYGAKDSGQVRRLLHDAGITSLFFSVAGYLCMFLFAEPIASVFNNAQNKELQAIAVEGLKLYFTSNIFVGFNIILTVYFPSVEHAASAHVLSLLRGLLLIVPLAFLLSSWFGMHATWLAVPAAELLTALIGIIMLRKNRQGAS